MSAPLPRLDPYLATLGEDVEDLSRIGVAQPFRSSGPTLSRADLDVLTRAADARLRRVAPTPALVEAGLMKDGGGLTDDGRFVTTVLTSPQGRLRVESGRGRAPLTLDVSVRGGVALALATASPASLPTAPRGEQILDAAAAVTLDVVDLAGVPALVASWVGLAPAWSLATSPEELPEQTVLARVDDPETSPPPGADAHLRHVWSQPWFLWTLGTSGGPTGLTMINAGPSGHLALTSTGTEGHVGLRAVPSAVVWSALVRTTGQLATG